LIVFLLCFVVYLIPKSQKKERKKKPTHGGVSNLGSKRRCKIHKVHVIIFTINLT
jgi:hypothetical protein